MLANSAMLSQSLGLCCKPLGHWASGQYQTVLVPVSGFRRGEIGPDLMGMRCYRHGPLVPEPLISAKIFADQSFTVGQRQTRPGGQITAADSTPFGSDDLWRHTGTSEILP